jgi:hypothetical protein
MKEVKMPYREYKQNYINNKTIKDSYDETEKTIVVCVPEFGTEMKQYDMDALTDQMYWGDGLPDGMEMDDRHFSVDGVNFLAVNLKDGPVCRNGAHFLCGGFSGTNSACTVKGTIIEAPEIII